MSGTIRQVDSATRGALTTVIVGVLLLVGSVTSGASGLDDFVMLGSKLGIASGINVVALGSKPGVVSGSNVLTPGNKPGDAGGDNDVA